MAKYIIPVSFDEKNYFWIVIDNGKLIRNPTKNDLVGAKVRRSYNDTNVCPICREENNITNNSILYPKNALNNKGRQEFVCRRHYKRYHSYNDKGRYTEDELLDAIRNFYIEEGRIPKSIDFENNKKYPSYGTYILRFGTWKNVLKKSGLLCTNAFEYTKNTTDEELLGYLIIYFENNGKPPSTKDFINNPLYPNYHVYAKRFGSWNDALKLVGLDIDSIVRKGIITTSQQKGRQAELHILDHNEKNATDLSGQNCLNFTDGISINGYSYDVKSARISEYGSWRFMLQNDYREYIEWFYLIGYDKDRKNVLHKWKIPNFDFIDINAITIGISNSYTHNVENMKEYEIQ